jgi:quercetin dioxygenase-like cupin family protein
LVSDREWSPVTNDTFDGGQAMTRWTLLVAAGIVLAAVGMTLARHDEDHEGVRPLAVREIVEKLDGRLTSATAVVVTLGPGEAGAPHRHPGPAFGYVLEGEYEWGIDDQPSRVLRAGETFYEPGGCLHRVTRNPGKVKTRVMAWVLHPRDAKQIAIPEKP